MSDNRFESSLFVYQWMIFNLVDISKHLKYCIKRENTIQLLCILVFESHHIKPTPFCFPFLKDIELECEGSILFPALVLRCRRRGDGTYSSIV